MGKTIIGFRIGDRVVWHTGFQGSDHGKPCWWPEDKEGKIITIGHSRLLLEFRDASREWADKSDCELLDMYLAKQEAEKLREEKEYGSLPSGNFEISGST